MNMEIPAELMQPTVEDLQERTNLDLEIEWEPCRRPGKKERRTIQKKDAETVARRVLRPTLKVSLEKSGKVKPI